MSDVEARPGRARRVTRIGTPGATPRHLGNAPGDVVHTSALLSTIDRLGATRPGQRRVALNAAQVEVVVEAAHEQHEVDVRGDDLRALCFAARQPGEL